MILRCFTPETARQALLRLRPTAETMCRLYRELETLRPVAVGGDQRVPPKYFERVRELHRSMSELYRQGVQVKDPKRGLVDFPARREGRIVLLCWQVGESSLEFWHEVDAGFAGRKRVDEDGPWDEPDQVGERAG